MEEYLIEISLNQKQELAKATAALNELGLKLNKGFVPKQLNIKGKNEKKLKKNYLIKGYLDNTAERLLKNTIVKNIWASNGYIPFK